MWAGCGGHCPDSDSPLRRLQVDHGIGATLALPGKQAEVVELALASKKPVVVLLFTTSPKNGDWMHRANAVLQAG